jgi:tetratricopeptide (TPR) repeat protein
LKTTAILAVLAQFACAQDQFEFGNLLEVRVEKADIPTEAEQSEALNKVRNAFHRKYQLATTKSEKETLVRQMLQISKDTEGANKYAVLKVSRDIAVLIGNAELAYQSILEMDEYFKVDLIDLKSEVLIGLSKTVSLGQRSNFANECLNVAEQALQQDKFDKAEELLGLIRSYAPRLPIGKSYADLNREVGIAKRQYKEIQIYIHKLAAHPEDSIAAVKVGEYYLKRGQWNKALELLAKSKTSLGELARLDLKSDKNEKEMLEVADDWWDRGEKDRARHWYQQALPSLAGLEKVRVEGRLSKPKEDHWKVIFNSDEPSDWLKLNASIIPKDIQYLKLEAMNQEIVIPITYEELIAGESKQGRYRWSYGGFNHNAFRLGIYDLHSITSDKEGEVSIKLGRGKDYRGWGFGACTFQRQQGYSWATKRIPKTIFTISVSNKINLE